MRQKDLTPKQQEVIGTVLCADCTVLVLGGPGTGKTTVALWCARAFLQLSGGLEQRRVLFLTFSRSAVSQIMRRCRGVLSGLENGVEIVTFHALAHRLLRAFGRYDGHGTVPPSIQSEARRKLLGDDPSQFTYNDLVPATLTLFKSSLIRTLISSRWQLIICDEVQDTNKEQWEMVGALAPKKLLLLGDPNQMIYTYIPGVSQKRFAQIRAEADHVIELEPASHRDPSGVIPALAEEVRCRTFDGDALTQALDCGRLEVCRDSDGSSLLAIVASLLDGHPRKEIGIFAHSNAAVAEIADQLTAAGVDHVLIGIPEAHSEALCAMMVQCLYAVGGATWAEVRTAFGLFLTSTVRGRKAPELARLLALDASLPSRIERGLAQLDEDIKKTAKYSIDDLASVVMRSWEGLRIAAGFRPWHQAATHFRRLIHPLRAKSVSADTISELARIVERARVEALIDLNHTERGRVRLMNYHQTKGREADVVIHVYRDDDYFGSECEPFQELSRLLNVALSRARDQVIIILPANPHALVEPFGRLTVDL